MLERWEEIFEEAQKELGLDWYELFDSDSFGKVEARIVEEFGEEILDSDEYISWYDEMAMDL